LTTTRQATPGYLAALFQACLMLSTKFSKEPEECVTNKVRPLVFVAAIGGVYACPAESP
jgi:hypothetical protein